jgi:hypothetical protein
MGDAKVKAIHSIHMKDFDQVVNLAHGNEFLSEVNSYFNI